MKEILKKVGMVVAALGILSFTALGAIANVSASPTPPTGNAAGSSTAVCQGAELADDDVDCSKKTTLTGAMDSVWSLVGTIVAYLMYAVGIICVVFIIIGGIKYATSGGDPEKVKGAKNTLLYAIIGLAVAILANVIITVVRSVVSNAGNDIIK